MLVSLNVAVVVQAVADLKFAIKEPDQQEEQSEGHAGLRAQQVLKINVRVLVFSLENGSVAAAVCVLNIEPCMERRKRQMRCGRTVKNIKRERKENYGK